MLRLIDEQLGRILLGLAILVAVGAACLNPRQQLAKVSEDLHRRSVLVPLDKKALKANSMEVFFMPDDGARYSGSDKYLWVQPIKVLQFSAVDLPLPPAAVMRPPQLLPEPGPALEGTHKLPRFGDEFPALNAANADNRAAPNQPATPAPAQPRPGLVTPGPNQPATPAPDPKVPPKPGPASPLGPRPPAKAAASPGGAKTPAKAPVEPGINPRTGDKNF